MQRFLVSLLLLAGTFSHAAVLKEVCPNAPTVVANVPVPSSAPGALMTGAVSVDFTIGVNGSVSNPGINATTDPALNEAALGIVAQLVCLPQPEDVRLRISVAFGRPLGSTESICPNFRSVMGGVNYPSEAISRGVESGDVLIDLTLSSDGTISTFRIVRMTDPAFAKVALSALVDLKCKGQGRDVHLQVPFGFRLK